MSIIPYLTIDNFTVRYMGKPVYDLKNIKPCANVEGLTSKFNGSTKEILATPDWYIKLKYQSVECEWSDAYCYRILSRSIVTRLDISYLPAIAEYMLRNNKSKLIVSNLISLLSTGYKHIITDIPEVGGIYVSNLNDCTSADHLVSYILEESGVNITKKTGNGVVLLAHNTEYAYQLAVMLGKKFIPVVLFGD